ncbi:hypothetical protein F4604DRAFT_1914864 [Suillus subluteus]|nr:hypothetical protein F4604DRAFT_1914864 [Suillus subluteus]
MELVSQFTEDAVAKEDRDCKRLACRWRIFKNDPCHYIANMIPGQPGRLVRATIILTDHNVKVGHLTAVRHVPLTQSMQRPPGMSRPLLDPSIIRQSVNDAQRKSTINPPPVIAFSQPSGSGISRTHAPGPDILVPPSWQLSQSLGQRMAQHKVPGAAGYSAQHAQYGSEYDWWAKLSYAPPPAETITLEISAVREGNSQRKARRGIIIGNICEGKKDIDAHIDAPGLIGLALNTIVPKLLTFGDGFPWRTDDFTVWDAAWVDLSTHQPNIPYFFTQCLVPSRRGQKAPTFKSKQFALSVIVPAAQWDKYEEWLEKLEELHHLSLAPDLPPATSTTYDFGGTAPDSPPATSTTYDFGGADDSNGIEDSAPEGTSDAESDSAQDHLVPSLSAKRTHIRAESDSRSSTVSPPCKKATPLMSKGSDELRLPGRDYLREALKCGGSTNPDVSKAERHEDVQYYAIPTHSLPEILKTPQYHTFDLNISDSYIGQLMIDIPLHSMIGTGAFKTAHPGWLTLSPVVSSGLGSRTQHAVIVCYSSADKLKHVLKESKVMYWAKSLLDYTYDYIDHHISTSSTPPPFEIPCPAQYGRKPGDTKAGTVSAVYLLEEHILFDDNKVFTKFIHNMDCVPSLNEDEYGYNLAVFLAFTQHLQYVQTEGLAFISDYQGSLTLLTDPQILTHPSVSEGGDVFGDGNIEGMVDEFERKHSCNHYCR